MTEFRDANGAAIEVAGLLPGRGSDFLGTAMDRPIYAYAISQRHV